LKTVIILLLFVQLLMTSCGGNDRPEIFPHEDFDHPFVRDYYNGIRLHLSLDYKTPNMVYLKTA
jgi:hypothetical protein